MFYHGFLEGSGSGWEGGGEELGGVEGGKTIIGIYCTREESILNKRKKGGSYV